MTIFAKETVDFECRIWVPLVQREMQRWRWLDI